MKKSERVAAQKALGQSSVKKNPKTAEKAVEEKTKELIREKAKEEKPKDEQKEKETRSRIFRNVDYNAPKTTQKGQRDKVRTGLFKILTPYLAQKRAGSLKAEKAKETFEAFKEYVTAEYTIPLNRAEEIFKGGEEGVAALNQFLPDFKAYLNKK